MKRIQRVLFMLKSSLNNEIDPNKQKIAGTLAATPLIAATTISGACAGGCPYGLVNDPYPGQCSHYTDLNNDGICDLSQSVTATSTSTDPTASSSDPSTPTQIDDRGNGVHNIYDGNSDVNASFIQDPGSGNLENGSVDGTDYHVFPITLLIIGGYLFTYYLFQKGILKSQQHKRIWNMLLIIGYIGTSATGILLTLLINLGISTIYNPSITYWHVELAILMVVGTLIHLHIYKKPFKNMFKVLFSFKSRSKKKKNRIQSIDMSK